MARGAVAYARGVSGADYLDAVETVHAYGREMAAFFEDHDILPTPTLAEPPAEIGRFAHDTEDYAGYRMGPGGVFAYSPYTAAFNASGQPAISLPLHWNDAGHPIGVQLVSAYGREDVLIAIAAQLEQAHPWRQRRPS